MERTAQPGLGCGQPQLLLTHQHPQGLLLPQREAPLRGEEGEAWLAFAHCPLCVPWLGARGMLPLCPKQRLGDSRPLLVLSVTSAGLLHAVPPASPAAVGVVSQWRAPRRDPRGKMAFGERVCTDTHHSSTARGPVAGMGSAAAGAYSKDVTPLLCITTTHPAQPCRAPGTSPSPYPCLSPRPGTKEEEGGAGQRNKLLLGIIHLAGVSVLLLSRPHPQ